MEGLRGLAVLLVFFVHFASLSQPWHQYQGLAGALLQRLHQVGNAGVDLFFVLSGYLIYGGLIDKQPSFWRYLQRRLWRIYPTFLAVLAIYLLISALLPQYSKLPAAAGAAAVYIVQNLLLLPGLFPVKPIIEVAWSLSYEMFFYLAMPAIIGALVLRRRSRTWRLGFFTLLWMGGLALAAVLAGPARLSLFIAGVLLYEVLRLRSLWPAHSAWAVLALLGCAAIMWLPMPGATLQSLRLLVLGLGFGLLCFVCFAQPAGAAGRLFSRTPLRWLGNMSYSYYLVHGLALHVFFAAVGRLLPPDGPGLAALALLLPALAWTLLVAAVLFVCCELPLSLRRKAPPAVLRAPGHDVRGG